MLELEIDGERQPPPPVPFEVYQESPQRDIVDIVLSRAYRTKLARPVGARPGEVVLAEHLFTGHVEAGDQLSLTLTPTKLPPTPGTRSSSYGLVPYSDVVVFAVGVGAIADTNFKLTKAWVHLVQAIPNAAEHLASMQNANGMSGIGYDLAAGLGEQLHGIQAAALDPATYSAAVARVLEEHKQGAEAAEAIRASAPAAP